LDSNVNQLSHHRLERYARFTSEGTIPLGKRRKTNVRQIDPSRLCEILLDENVPGMLFMLIWSEVDEESEGYRALSHVLFDEEEVDDESEGRCRDGSDPVRSPVMRRNVADCVERYSEVRLAAERVILEIESKDLKR
jgi:hypothetical protein